jgi:hypothetical protein
MKIYDFKNRKIETGRVIFALSLNRTRLTERIIIGRENEVRLILNGGSGEVYYDEVRPFGSLLFDFESDKNGEWESHIPALCESYELKYSFGARWNKVEPVSEFLMAKYNSGEPSAMFAAVCTWEDYLGCFNMNQATKTLTDRLVTLYQSFAVYAAHRPWQKESANTLADTLIDGDSSVELWYPMAKRPFETVVIISSFLPIISYYLYKVEEWGLVYLVCKHCGKNFIARNRHHELCSDECRKQKAVTAKREYDEWAKGNKPEQDYEAAYYYWYNRWRKIRKGEAANPDGAAAFKAGFDNFRKEAVQRKRLVGRGGAEEKAFADWLFKQQGEADRLIVNIL